MARNRNRKSAEPETVSTESTAATPETQNQETPNMITLSLVRSNKKGNKGTYQNPSVNTIVVLPTRMFANKTLPPTVEFNADGIAMLSAEEATKAAERAAKRAEQAGKPKPTAAERQAILDARTAKLEDKLARARKQSEKLAASQAVTPVAEGEPVVA